MPDRRSAGDDEPPRVEVFAGGGLVVRPHTSPCTVAVVHRPEYDDWSLPKGKVDPGETVLDAALREVLEETGLRCVPGPPAGTVHYRDSRNRSKEVRYWFMSEVGGTFAPNREVDVLEWWTLDDASDRLTYDHDRAFVRDASKHPWLDELAARPGPPPDAT